MGQFFKTSDSGSDFLLTVKVKELFRILKFVMFPLLVFAGWGTLDFFVTLYYLGLSMSTLALN